METSERTVKGIALEKAIENYFKNDYELTRKFDPFQFVELRSNIIKNTSRLAVTVSGKIMWVRTVYPRCKISQRIISSDGNSVVAETRIYAEKDDAEDNYLANGFARVTAAESDAGEGMDYFSKAMTFSLSSALSSAGFTIPRIQVGISDLLQKGIIPDDLPADAIGLPNAGNNDKEAAAKAADNTQGETKVKRGRKRKEDSETEEPEVIAKPLETYIVPRRAEENTQSEINKTEKPSADAAQVETPSSDTVSEEAPVEELVPVVIEQEKEEEEVSVEFDYGAYDNDGLSFSDAVSIPISKGGMSGLPAGKVAILSKGTLQGLRQYGTDMSVSVSNRVQGRAASIILRVLESDPTYEESLKELYQ